MSYTLFISIGPATSLRGSVRNCRYSVDSLTIKVGRRVNSPRSNYDLKAASRF
jgi:hypothetical protein